MPTQTDWLVDWMNNLEMDWGPGGGEGGGGVSFVWILKSPVSEFNQYSCRCRKLKWI